MDPRNHHPRRPAGAVHLWLAILGTLALPASLPIEAQVRSPSQRLDELEKANRELLERVQALEEEIAKEKAQAASGEAQDKKKEPLYSDGVISLGGVKLELGGKVELLFIDPQNESDPVVGSTDNPDPHFELQRLRIEPRLTFSKAISVEAQIDIRPTQGDTYLRELTARFSPKRPVWWLDSEVSIGLDDRFMQPSRRTKNYPLLGNAFWRRESLALTLYGALGDKDGPPEAGGKKAAKPSRTAGDTEGGFRDDSPREMPGDTDESVVVVRKRSPFDFSWNPGELDVYFSVGHGYTLNNNEVGFDGAPFNDIVQDDGNLDTDLSIREIGVGLGYRRNFEWLGELGALGFYYNDELNDTSQQFLQNDLTVYAGGVPVAGYGLSDSDRSERFGFSGEYFLPASVLFGQDFGADRKDGLYLSGQWIRGWDGELRRQGWYVQGSFRFSFPERVDPEDGRRSRGLVANRYFRSIEPIVRYGLLDLNLDPDPRLPMLWDRKELCLGAFIEVTSEVFLKIEYTFNWEQTGASPAVPGPKSVANNELLVELLLEF